MYARMLRFAGTAAVAVLLFTATVPAQQPVTVGETVTETFTIEAIDRSTRIVSLKDKDGLIEDVVLGPDVQRFDALKVGDRVSMRYTESMVTAISRSGSAPKAGDTTAVTRAPGAAPGGTIARQMTTTVTLDAMDPKVPSVSITTADGRKMSFRIANAKNLEGFKVGDKVDVTYTQALAISVEPAK